MKEVLSFKVSSALKDIIGRDLITDDYIAVFELVKNSFDARATTVDIYFENIYDSNSKIFIKDNGKGMDLDGIKNKWLFVAYSAKRDGTEDDNSEYRDSIHAKRPYAGYKGIGRFSCDRLGKFLKLETTKKSDSAKTEIIKTNWEAFEADLKQEFVDVSVDHQTKEKTEPHGTTLEISGLRSKWTRQKLLGLKDSLAKLINPSSGKEEQPFIINLHVPEEIENDKRESEYYSIINGEVKNFIFEALELKTTKIISSISADGKIMKTELFDGGELIYDIKEANTFSSLWDIKTTIFYLNQSAKLTFARRMGITTKNYGNIFVYKNGFRIYPYGEPGEDPLKIDSRKQQGHSRYLGTREIIGRSEINGDQPDLRETTSRGDGFIKTETYYELEEFFWKCLKRLEKYVIDVQRWGLSIEDQLNQEDEAAMKDRITGIIGKLTESKELLDIDYGKKFLDLVSKHASSQSNDVITELKELATKTNNEDLKNAVSRAENILDELKDVKGQIEKEAIVAKAETQKVKETLEKTIKENLLLKEASKEDTVEILSIEHHINQSTFRISNDLKDLAEMITNKEDSNAQLKLVNQISLENRKISSLVNYVRKATFDTMSASFEGDLNNYVIEYVENVYKEDRIRIVNKQLIDVDLEYDPEEIFITKFVPLEINIILDNLLDNSKKAKSTKAWIKTSIVNNNELHIVYRDDGTGIKDEDLERIFDFGFSTTPGGSGIGLFHILELVRKNYNGSIEVNNSIKPGVEFNIKLKPN